MTEKEFKSTKFGYGDKVKIKGVKGEHLIYEVDFENCLISVFDKWDKMPVQRSYLINYSCQYCTLIKQK